MSLVKSNAPVTDRSPPNDPHCVATILPVTVSSPVPVPLDCMTMIGFTPSVIDSFLLTGSFKEASAASVTVSTVLVPMTALPSTDKLPAIDIAPALLIRATLAATSSITWNSAPASPRVTCTLSTPDES